MSFRYFLALSIILSGLLLCSLAAEDELIGSSSNHFRFAIRYLGMRITEVDMVDTRTGNQGTVVVQASSVSLGNILFRIRNTYTIDYIDDYLPVEYTKSVRQKNFRQDKVTRFNRTERRLENWVDDRYSIFDDIDLLDSRDFFSALLQLRYREISDTGDEIALYANNNIWKGVVSIVRPDRVDRRNTIKYRIDFYQQTDNSTQRSDVLTNNIVKEGSALYLWITDDHLRLPLKAEYDASPFSVFWTLEDFDITAGLERP